MRQAWARRPGNVLAISKSLRMNSWACRRRFLVMGLIEPLSEQEVARTAHYRAMSLARCSGCSIREVARRTNVSQRVADQTLRMLAISGRKRSKLLPAAASALSQAVDANDVANAPAIQNISPSLIDNDVTCDNSPAPEPALEDATASHEAGESGTPGSAQQEVQDMGARCGADLPVPLMM